jgi:hypothetical protein
MNNDLNKLISKQNNLTGAAQLILAAGLRL